MDDGFIQLLFFLVVIIFSIMDAIARKRKKEREMEDLDRPERQQEERGSLHRREEEVPDLESYGEAEEARDERGADTLIPGDLWEEITGMKRPSPPPTQAPEPASDDRRDVPSTRSAPEPRMPAPAPSPVPAPPPRPTPWGSPQPSATRGREARSSEARSSEARSSEARQDQFPERLRTTALGEAAEEIREKGRRELTEVPIAPELDEALDRKHPQAPQRRFPGPSRRRGSASAASLRSSLRGGPEALKKAVLYREVLGRPLGSRPGPGGWEEPAG